MELSISGRDLLKLVKTVEKAGGSLRVVIPGLVAKHLDIKKGDSVVFLPKGEGEAIIVKVRPGTIEKFSYEILAELEKRKRVKSFVERLPEEISRENISVIDEFKELMDELRESVRILREIARRELHFSDENEYFASIILELESEREEEFKGILDYTKMLRERREKIMKALGNIEKWLSKGKITERIAREISERLKGELELVDRRIEMLREVIE